MTLLFFFFGQDKLGRENLNFPKKNKTFHLSETKAEQQPALLNPSNRSFAEDWSKKYFCCFAKLLLGKKLLKGLLFFLGNCVSILFLERINGAQDIQQKEIERKKNEKQETKIIRKSGVASKHCRNFGFFSKNSLLKAFSFFK
jgi:hypothetical protein